MSVLYAFVAAGLFGCGLYMVLSRHLVRLLLGLSLLTTAVNLVLFQAGRIRVGPAAADTGGRRPAARLGGPAAAGAGADRHRDRLRAERDPRALALRAYRGHGTLRSDEIRSAERLGDPFADRAERCSLTR